MIRSFCDEAYLEGLELHPSFKTYPKYRSIVTRKSHLYEIVKEEDSNLCLAVWEEKLIVGIGILEYPQKDQRWAQLGKWMMEVSVIEVIREFRGKGLAKGLLKSTTEHPLKERKILFMVGYSWTWDLVGTGLKVMEYREMLINLFQSEDFKVYQTNEPNVLLRPENLFMARIGAMVPAHVLKAFKWLRFGIIQSFSLDHSYNMVTM